MKIVLVGATGFVGCELGLKLAEQGHELVVLCRDPRTARLALPFPCQIIGWEVRHGDLVLRDQLTAALRGADAVINLAGEPIHSKPWSAARIAQLTASRVDTTSAIASAIRDLGSDAPKTFVNASAVGWYGDRGDEVLTEFAAVGRGPLSEICIQWENAASTLETTPTRVVILRLGIVLGKQGGMLANILPLFRRGLAGNLGSGKQWMSWIHVNDAVGIVLWALTSNIRGVLNGTSPEPVPHSEFTHTLASLLKRRLLPPVPDAILKILLGRRAALVLDSQRVLPHRPLEAGYVFRFPKLRSALEDILPHESSPNTEELVVRQWVPQPVEKVFGYFQDERNLEALTPASLHFHVAQKSTAVLGSGTLIDYRLKLHGLPITWQSRIEGWNPPHSFVDTQLKGPYQLWQHTHVFTSLAGGTLVVDKILYRLPLGWLGLVLGGALVKRDLRHIFAFRRTKVAALFC